MLPGKSKSIKKAKTPYDKLQNQLGYLGLEVDAGVLTQAQGDNAIIRAVNKALPNLTGSNKLRAMGEQASSAAGSPQPSEAAEAGQAGLRPHDRQPVVAGVPRPSGLPRRLR
jgi:hypothetical protein